MGLRGKHADAVRVFSREGFTLGTEDGDAPLIAQLEDFRPDLVVIDTLMSTTAVDVNDNVAAVKWMQRKAIAEATDEPDAKQPSGTWKDALKAAVDAGHIEHVGQRYRITPEGKQRLIVLGMEF